MGNPYTIGAILALQIAAAFVFIFDLLLPLLGIPIVLAWHIHELIELAAAMGLMLGVGLGLHQVRLTARRTREMEDRFEAVSATLADLMHRRFDQWGLTPAESDVALFLIKGLTTQEIAEFRTTSEGTVKAQTNAIYRKSGVTGRPQLLSLFIEDMMDDDFVPRPSVEQSAAK